MRNGKTPTLEEISASTGLPERRVIELRQYVQPVMSLDQPLSDENEGSIADVLADNAASAEMDGVSQGTLGEELDRLMRYLNPRERQLLELRFGLDGGGNRTLEDIGNRLGITRERARQIEAKALLKLRNFTNTENLRDYFAS